MESSKHYIETLKFLKKYFKIQKIVLKNAKDFFAYDVLRLKQLKSLVHLLRGPQ